MSLRVRDSCTAAAQRRRNNSKLIESSRIVREKKDRFVVLDLRENQPPSFPSFSDDPSITRGRYVFSFASESKVTFVNTKKPRFSAPRTLSPIIINCDAQKCPLDLTSESRAKSRDARNLPSALVDCHVGLNDTTDDENFAYDLSTRANGSSLGKLSNASWPNSKHSYVEMLSSRRHHSDETFSDRERSATIDRNSSYPRSADAWLDCRSSPNQDSVDLSDTSEYEAKSNHSDAECSFKKKNKEELLSDIGDAESDKMDDFQDIPFNYSTRNKETNCPQNVESLKKAKRARVENIVTSIKDKPNWPPADEFSADHSFVGESACANKQYRKRKRGEQIRELKKQLETLEKESEMEDTYGNNFDDYEKEDDFKRDWKPPQKRPRNDVDVESPPNSTARKNSNGFYRGSINLMVSQNGRRRPSSADHVTSNLAFEVLCRTIKHEIGAALNKIAEKAAKKVLEEFTQEANKQESGSEETENKRTREESNLNEIGVNRSEFGNDEVVELVGTKKPVKSSRYIADEESERLMTSNQSQMCFGDVRVRKSDSSRKQDALHQARRPSNRERFESETWEENVFSSDSRDRSPDVTKSSPEPEEIQTQALSLVKKKTASFHSEKSPHLEERSFPLRSDKEQLSSTASSPDQEPGKSFKYPRSSFSDSRSFSNKSPLDTSLKSKFPHPNLPPESNFYSSSSSAFRLPFRNDSIPPPNFRRDSYPAPSMLKAPPFSFGPSLYPSSAGQSQSVFPFSTGQLSFPLFQSLHQRSLANVIADYGRFREGFEHGTNRPVSTRTSTRDPPRTPGIVRSLSGHKSENLEFRNIPNEVSPYSTASIQEGLTPQHLKKAKLMFFYTRYPSANTLKTYFSDVKFSRATTSQLIKWFSNFREFYYIQMEKFARQALSDGLVDIKQLKVNRDSELFRVLNLHYNKSNDFQVPNEFLATTLRTLQEFFLAIQKGKDQDPSWKKVIYKIICKLDQDIPELFKLHNVLERLDEVNV